MLKLILEETSRELLVVKLTITILITYLEDVVKGLKEIVSQLRLVYLPISPC